MNFFTKSLVGLRRWHAIVLSCLLMMGASTAFATEFVFSRGAAISHLGIGSYDGYADVRLNNAFPDNGAGVGQIFAGDAGNAAINRSLVRWDLSSLAAGTILGDATLTMRVSNLSQDDEFETVDGADFFDFHRIVDTNAGWLEDMNNNVAVGPAVDLEPSWNNFSQTPLQAWGNSGGTGNFPGLGAAGDGYNTTPAFTLNQASYTTGDDVQITVPQAVIEDIIAGGANHPGYMLRARDEFFAGRIAFSSNASLHSLTIDVDIPIQVAELEIDRTTGAMTLVNNTGSPIDFKSYSITSGVGGLDATEWTRVVDANSWTDLSASTGELSEEESPFVNGSQLASGGGTSPLGNVWIQSPDEDLMMELTLNDDSTQIVAVSYIGNGDVPFGIGDLNFSGSVTEADWPIYKAGFDQDLSALSQAEAYGMGDLNNDGVNDHADFVLFRSAFDANLGAGAFDAMLSNVPEPSSLALMILGGLLLLKRNPAMKTKVMLAALVVSLSTTGLCHAATLLDVDFPNDTGGTNPTFDEIDNNFMGDTNGTWDQATGTISNAPTGFSAVGAASSFSFDPTAIGTDSLTLTANVDSTTGTINSNGIFVGFQRRNNGGTGADLWNNLAVSFGLVISGNAGVGHGVRHVDVGGNLGSGRYQEGAGSFGVATEASIQDGFDVELTITSSGWDLSLTGLEDDLATPITGGAGVWDAGGVNPVNAFSAFSSDTRVGASQQSQGGSMTFSHIDLQQNTVDLPTLEVNTITGAATILNDTATTFDMEYYEITSANDALDTVGWNSFEEQDLEGNGPPNDTGDGWEVLGTPRDGKIAESYLQGSLMLGNGDDETLGNAFDTSVFGSGTDGDLVFKIGLTDDSLLSGNVMYVTTAQPGDFDSDGDVDGADFLEWQRSDGTPGGLTAWQTNYGAGALLASAAASVPEPSSALLLMVCAVACSCDRRRTARR